MDEKNLVPVSEYADITGVSVQSIYQRIRKGTLDAVKVQNKLLVKSPENIKGAVKENIKDYKDKDLKCCKRLKAVKKRLKAVKMELKAAKDEVTTLREQNTAINLSVLDMMKLFNNRLEHKDKDYLEAEVVKEKKHKKDKKQSKNRKGKNK